MSGGENKDLHRHTHTMPVRTQYIHNICQPVHCSMLHVTHVQGILDHSCHSLPIVQIHTSHPLQSTQLQKFECWGDDQQEVRHTK